MDELETGETWGEEDTDLLDEEMPADEMAWRRTQAELRHALGVDDVSGYSIVDDPDGLPAMEQDAGAWPGAEPMEHSGPRTPVGDSQRGEETRKADFPCLSGGRYTGCLGMACALETCWTGAATVSFAHHLRMMRTHVSTTLYLPGAPCHDCIHVQEAMTPPHHPCFGMASGKRDGERSGAPAEGTEARQRVTCARGLWAHPISLASFVTKRIPMCEPHEPQNCPCYTPRGAPHPAVAEHLRRRRERTRRQREGRRERKREG